MASTSGSGSGIAFAASFFVAVVGVCGLVGTYALTPPSGNTPETTRGHFNQQHMTKIPYTSDSFNLQINDFGENLKAYNGDTEAKQKYINFTQFNLLQKYGLPDNSVMEDIGYGYLRQFLEEIRLPQRPSDIDYKIDTFKNDYAHAASNPAATATRWGERTYARFESRMNIYANTVNNIIDASHGDRVKVIRGVLEYWNKDIKYRNMESVQMILANQWLNDVLNRLDPSSQDQLSLDDAVINDITAQIKKHYADIVSEKVADPSKWE